MALSLYVDARFASPYAMSAFVALKEKAVPFELVPVSLGAQAHHTPEYAKTSLTRRVPTLVHDDFSLSESSAIDEYVDETFSGVALYPKAARDRARARQLQAWVRSDLMPIREERSTDTVFYKFPTQPLSANAQSATRYLIEVAEAVIAPNATNLFGEWCIADTDFAMMLNRLVANGDAVPPRIAAYVRAQWSRPSVQAWLALPRTQ